MLDKSDGKTKELIEMAHPLTVALCQVIIDSDHVDALSCESVEVNRESSHEGFTFTCLHLSDTALMKAHTADELNIKMAHAENTARCLAADRKSLRQDIVQSLSGFKSVLELLCISGKRSVAEVRKTCLKTVYLIYNALISFNFFFVIITEKPFQESPQN